MAEKDVEGRAHTYLHLESRFCPVIREVLQLWAGVRSLRGAFVRIAGDQYSQPQCARTVRCRADPRWVPASCLCGATRGTTTANRHVSRHTPKRAAQGYPISKTYPRVREHLWWLPHGDPSQLPVKLSSAKGSSLALEVLAVTKGTMSVRKKGSGQRETMGVILPRGDQYYQRQY